MKFSSADSRRLHLPVRHKLTAVPRTAASGGNNDVVLWISAVSATTSGVSGTGSVVRSTRSRTGQKFARAASTACATVASARCSAASAMGLVMLDRESSRAALLRVVLNVRHSR